MKTPEQVANGLREFLEQDSDIIAVWEGGSAATGYLDEYSDLDLAIVCNDDSVENIIELVDEYLENNYGIERRFRLPEPTWHGFSQCYYQIRNVPELYYLDISFMKKSLPDKFTESDRHGNAVIWFEKEKVIDSTPTPQDKVLARAKQFYRIATQADFITIIEINKAIARKRYSEAFPFYYQFIARNLGIMLNLKYRPCKVDFGLRYSYRDYEKADAELIEDLFKIESLEELNSKFRIALNRYEQLKEELKAYKD